MENRAKRLPQRVQMSQISETGQIIKISVSTTLFPPRQTRKGAQCSKYRNFPLTERTILDFNDWNVLNVLVLRAGKSMEQQFSYNELCLQCDVTTLITQPNGEVFQRI